MLEYKLRRLSHNYYVDLLRALDPTYSNPPTVISLNYDIIVNPLEERYTCHGFPCPQCTTFVEPVLITPTQIKDYRNPHVAKVWNLAEQALRDAERVFIVGYSLPDDDLDVIYLLKRGLSQLAYSAPQNITVVEKTSDEAIRPINKHPVGRRYRSIFGPNIDWRTDGFEGLIDGLLPWEGIPVRLRLQVRKFFCPNSECHRRIFCERLPEVVARYAHRTDRLNEALSSIGFALGGRQGVKAATKLGMQTGADSILRCVRNAMACLSDEMKVRALGVDDWALEEGAALRHDSGGFGKAPADRPAARARGRAIGRVA